MEIHPRTCLLALGPSGARIKAWVATASEAEALAEALHEARPGWAVRFGGRDVVFSRDGKVVAFAGPPLSRGEAVAHDGSRRDGSRARGSSLVADLGMDRRRGRGTAEAEA